MIWKVIGITSLILLLLPVMPSVAVLVGVVVVFKMAAWLLRGNRRRHGIRTARRQIPAAVKAYVWERDGGRCVLCGTDQLLEYDHIIPYSKGGSDSVSNIRLVCGRENRAKGAMINYA